MLTHLTIAEVVLVVQSNHAQLPNSLTPHISHSHLSTSDIFPILRYYWIVFIRHMRVNRQTQAQFNFKTTIVLFPQKFLVNFFFPYHLVSFIMFDLAGSVCSSQVWKVNPGIVGGRPQFSRCIKRYSFARTFFTDSSN